MDKQTTKELINFILVITFSVLYVIYIAPTIMDKTRGIFVALGLWCIIIGIWGNIVGLRIAKSLFDDPKTANYFSIIGGIFLIALGLILKYLSRI